MGGRSPSAAPSEKRAEYAPWTAERQVGIVLGRRLTGGRGWRRSPSREIAEFMYRFKRKYLRKTMNCRHELDMVLCVR